MDCQNGLPTFLPLVLRHHHRSVAHALYDLSVSGFTKRVVAEFVVEFAVAASSIWFNSGYDGGMGVDVADGVRCQGDEVMDIATIVEIIARSCRGRKNWGPWKNRRG